MADKYQIKVILDTEQRDALSRVLDQADDYSYRFFGKERQHQARDVQLIRDRLDAAITDAEVPTDGGDDSDDPLSADWHPSAETLELARGIGVRLPADS
jgi:hypothetical protein